MIRRTALLLTTAVALAAAVVGTLALITLYEGFGVLLELVARSLEETP